MFEKNIPGCLVTTNKTAYKPFKVSLEGIQPKIHKVEAVPFYGSTTNENTYINFGSTRLSKGIEMDKEDVKITFRGKSLYSTDFKNNNPNDYMKKQIIFTTSLLLNLSVMFQKNLSITLISYL